MFIDDKDIKSIIFALQNELSSLHIVHKKYSDSCRISIRLKDDISNYNRILKKFIEYETNNNHSLEG